MINPKLENKSLWRTFNTQAKPCTKFEQKAPLKYI